MRRESSGYSVNGQLYQSESCLSCTSCSGTRPHHEWWEVPLLLRQVLGVLALVAVVVMVVHVEPKSVRHRQRSKGQERWPVYGR